MSTQVYLFFDGRCEEALTFYKNAVGAKVETLLRHRDHPGPSQPGMAPPGSEDKIMHASFSIGDTLLMASDGRCAGKPHFEGFSLSLPVADAAAADRTFAALSVGGKVEMPLTETFWSPRFGMVLDPFGVRWMVTVAQAAPN